MAGNWRSPNRHVESVENGARHTWQLESVRLWILLSSWCWEVPGIRESRSTCSDGRSANPSFAVESSSGDRGECVSCDASGTLGLFPAECESIDACGNPPPAMPTIQSRWPINCNSSCVLEIPDAAGNHDAVRCTGQKTRKRHRATGPGTRHNHRSTIPIWNRATQYDKLDNS